MKQLTRETTVVVGISAWKYSRIVQAFNEIKPLVCRVDSRSLGFVKQVFEIMENDVRAEHCEKCGYQL